MIYFLSFLIFLFLILLILSVKKNLYFQNRIEEINGKLEESLDVLDEVYQRIVEKTKLEVLSDEPVVRELAEDLKISRDSVLHAALLVTDSLNQKTTDEGSQWL